MKDAPKYNASSIKALDQHTHLMKRLNLTFGHETGSEENKFSSQKSVAIRELTDNAIDEIRSGYGTRMRIIFHKDNSIEVQDNGRGMPVDIGKDSAGKPSSGIYLCLGVIQSGGKFETDSNRQSLGLNGVGASSTVHCSKRADVSVYRNDKVYTLSFQDGTPGFFANESPDSEFTPISDLTYLKEGKDPRSPTRKKMWPTGTTVKVWLRDSVFSSKYPVNVDDLIERLRGTSFLEKRATIEILNEHRLVETPDGKEIFQEEIFHSDEGISELVRLNQTKAALSPILYLKTETSFTEAGVAVLKSNGKVVNEDVKREIPIELALSWDNGYVYNIESYVNTIRTRLGGVHEASFEKALVNAFNEKFSTMRGVLPKGMDMPIIDDYKEGMTAVLSVGVSEPQFTGQAKEELGGRDVRQAILKALVAEFTEFANSSKNSETMKIIGQKVCNAARVRQEQREARDLQRKKSQIESSNELPLKLIDCNVVYDDRSELYIAEGDSAIGALKGARNAENQALLPIRGKIINAHKTTMAKVLQNEEATQIIQCLSAGVGENFDITKVRYGRIFLAADADPDGGSICSLVLVLLWHIARPMIEQGRVYQMLTPLFAIKTKGSKPEHFYCADERERDKAVAKLDKAGKKYDVSRIKGLGECPAEILSETGMSAMTRTVRQVVVGDITAAQEMLDICLADDAAPRKAWIERNPVDNTEVID